MSETLNPEAQCQNCGTFRTQGWSEEGAFSMPVANEPAVWWCPTCKMRMCYDCAVECEKCDFATTGGRGEKRPPRPPQTG